MRILLLKVNQVEVYIRLLMHKLVGYKLFYAIFINTQLSKHSYERFKNKSLHIQLDE